MTLEPPPIDDRSYRELFEEALARIPVHTPEWTNRNDADPGVTLLQLWAYMSETLLYRSALIPERNRIAFLRLLGYDRLPAQAARGMVAFTNKRGPLSPVVLDRDLQVNAGSVPFRTDNGLAVLPLDGRAYVKRRADIDPSEQTQVDEEYRQLYAGFRQPGEDFAYYETSPVDWSAAATQPVDLGATVDGALWLALLARSGDLVDQVRDAIADRVLTLGIVPDVTITGASMPAGGTDPLTAGPGLEFALPNVGRPLPDDPEGRVATYVPVPATSRVDLLATPGVVQLELPQRSALGMWALDPIEDGVGAFPPTLEGDTAERLVTWLRIRPTTAADGGVGAAAAAGDPTGSTAQPAQASAKLRWAGINAATVQQRSHVAVETLGTGSGQADQQVQLANTPVLLDSLDLRVGGKTWRRVEDLMTAAPEVPLVRGSSPELADPAERSTVYTLDRADGTVRFGDGIHGRRPPADALIEASYDYGGGRDGMVAAEAIGSGPGLPAGVKVANPVATWGGDERESVEEAEAHIAGYVRHRDRLVTAEDFGDIVARTPGIDLGRVEVLPLHSPTNPGVATPGAVTLMLVPRFDAAHPDTPEPDRFFLDAVCAHLDPRRLITTEVHLRGPEYVPVWVSVGIDVLGGHDLAVVRQEVTSALRTFLSPLHGGRNGEGWPLATDVERLELWAEAARVRGVAKVFGVRLGEADGADTERVELSALRLPRLRGVSVRPNAPQPLDEVQGSAPPEEPPARPIPYVPAEC